LDEKRIDQIVDLVIQEIKQVGYTRIENDTEEKSSIRQKALLVFNGVPSGLGEALSILEKTCSSYEYYAVLSESAEKLLDKKIISDSLGCSFLQPDEAYRMIPKVCTVVFPNLSQNTAAKAVRGIRDSIGSEMIALSLREDKNVLVVSDWILSEKMPQAYRVFCNDIVVRLSRIGVHVTEIGKLKEKLENNDSNVKEMVEGLSSEIDLSSRKLLSTRDIEDALSKKVSKIIISSNTIVTPLARDLASEKDLSLVST
jgi:hypothetical protein